MGPLKRATHKEWCRLRRPDNTAECDCGVAEKYYLSDEEIAEGWHWCPEWDGLLVGPGMPEMESCVCQLSLLL